jgi:type IV secretion system protein TrbL
MADAHTLLVHAAGCTRLPCPNGDRIVALSWGDLNPLKWLGKGASAVATDAWKGAMTALWSAGLWVLGLAFKIIDAFTTPDLSADGPLAEVLPYTFAIGAMIAVLMALVQIGFALYQRDGKSLARVMVGVIQFGAVWIGYIAIAAMLVTATAGLTKGLLQGLLHVDAFSGFSNSGSWPRQVDDTVVATVLGLCTVFLIFPAAIGYVLIMLVREAALMLLTATSPISAGGLLSEGTKSWFWKSMRWFLASLMICPLAALVLGIGVKITQGTIAGNGDKTAAAVGMAVTGCILILIGAICPLILFRMLAFVDPGTSSGAAMRQSLAANGGMAGLLGGKSGGSESGSSATAGSGAATKQDGQGRSQGESSADSATQSRFSSMMGGAGQVMQKGANALNSVGSKAASIGADVLGSAGVGHQAPYFGQGDISSGGSGSGQSGAGQSVPGNGSSGGGDGQNPDPSSGGGGDGGSEPPTPPMPHPPTPPTPGGGAPSVPGMPGGGGGGAGGAGGAAGGAGAAAEVPVVPV